MLHNTNVTGSKMAHAQFQTALVEGLIGGHTEERKKVGRVVCAQQREKGFKGSRIGTWCKDCGVALCAIGCFRRYHTLSNP